MLFIYFCLTPPLFFSMGKMAIRYNTADVSDKREIIGSIYPEKLTFNGERLRTTRLNEVVSLIYTLDKGFRGIKKKTNQSFFDLSRKVGAAERTNGF
jgi:site-specific DNA recombinase